MSTVMDHAADMAKEIIALKERNRELLAALVDAAEELRLIRMKDSPACYDPTLRPHIACIINRAKAQS